MTIVEVNQVWLMPEKSGMNNYFTETAAFEPIRLVWKKNTVMLPEDALHSVTNPLQRFTGGIHIYGGDFFDTPRSQWNSETLEEESSDGAKIREIFRRENERLGLSK